MFPFHFIIAKNNSEWFKKSVKIQVSELVVGSAEQDNVFQCLVGNLLIFVGSMSKSKSKYTYLNRNVLGLVLMYLYEMGLHISDKDIRN